MSKLIGDRIYSLRKKLGLSQEEFANRIGVSRQVVSKWEMNQVIPLTDKLKKISEEFNISYDEIFGDKDSIKRNNIIRYILIFLGIIIVEVIIILIYTYILDKKDMEYRCIGTKTYYVDKIYDSDDDNYKFDGMKLIKTLIVFMCYFYSFPSISYLLDLRLERICFNSFMGMIFT